MRTRRIRMSDHRLSNILVVAATVLVLLGATGCTADDARPSSETTRSTAQPSVASQPEPSAAPGTGRFDPLSFSLRLPSTSVQQGKTLRSRAIVENKSNKVVVDPRCVIAEGRYALVPVDQPDAELWVRPFTDCGGPHRMPPGYRDVFRGPDFYARTKFGDPLPPGEYLAVLEIGGLSQRLEHPVTVTP